MKSIMFIALCILMIFCGAAGAETVTVATGEWPPYVSEELEQKGFIAEILTKVFREMGLNVEYVFYPWRRCYDSVIKGKAWAAFPYSRTEQREKEVLFSDKISFSVTSFFVYKKKQDIAYTKLEDLKPYRMGGVIGYFYEEAFKAHNCQVDFTSNEQSALEKLILGRTDLLPLNEMVGWHLIRSTFPDEVRHFKVLDNPYSIDDLHLIISKTKPENEAKLIRFNNALRVVKDQFIYQSILDRLQKQ